MAKTAKFELIGTIVDHPEHKDLARGDVLTLEVGDDGKPTSELFRSRTRPLGRSVCADARDAADGVIEQANTEAQKIVEAAKQEAEKLLQAAKDDAALVVQTAQAEAQDIITKANVAKK